MKRIIWFLIIFFIGAINGTAVSSEIPKELLPIVEKKGDIALDLSLPIAECITKSDSHHALFHGCINWHSSVHAMWSLIAYTRATNDDRYKPLIDRLLDISKMEDERKLLADHGSFEMPYGRAWFLRFVIEYRRYSQTDLFKCFGDQVAESLVQYFKKNPPDPCSKSYDSASWALINLLDYGFETKNIHFATFASDRVRKYFINKKGSCENTEKEPEFMAVSTNNAWLVSKVLPREQFIEWFKPRKAIIQNLKPITSPRTSHEFGKNFSRAWGLWEIYSITGDIEFASSYARHFMTTYSDIRNWKEDYQKVGHWVPQFGMFAIQPLFGNFQR